MRNKILAISLIVLFSWANIQAQTEKGRFIVGAGSAVNVSNSKGDFSETSNPISSITILIKPEVGYFLLDDFSVGVSVSVLGYTSGNSSAHADFLSEFKYFFKGNNIRPYVKANVGYKYIDFAGMFWPKIQMSLSDAQGFAFGGGFGGAFFVRDNFSIDLGLNYLHSNLKRFYSGYISSGTANNNPLKASMDEVKVFVGFSVYL